jgi:polyhydroxyalkanoate synthase
MEQKLSEIDIPKMTAEFQQALQQNYESYLKGTRAIQESDKIPVGQTPKELIWTLNKTKLYRYVPQKPEKELHKTPLILVYALINKPYIFDLAPGRSFVEYLLEEGFDIYLVDWGTPGDEDKDTTFDDYVTKYLYRAVRKMQRVSGRKQFSMLGYCIGAVFATLYAALYPKDLKNLLVLTPPLDFSKKEESVFANWLDEKHFNVDEMVDSLGNIPVEFIETGSKMLKPVENYVGSYKTLWETLDDEKRIASWQLMNKWVHDGVPFAGEAFRQWVKDYIRANKLFNGQRIVNGEKVDLAKIKCAFYNVVAKFDHIVPGCQSTTIMDKVASQDKHMELIPAGHVGIMAGKGARHKLWPNLSQWLAERS